LEKKKPENYYTRNTVFEIEFNFNNIVKIVASGGERRLGVGRVKIENVRSRVIIAH